MKNYMDGGEAILEAFRKLKIDYIMSSPGSEWSPVWEALARQKLGNHSGPTYVDAWHETLAVNMATGYTLITGRPQAVLVHAGVGLLQGSMGVHGAMQSEVPMIVTSGAAGERIHELPPRAEFLAKPWRPLDLLIRAERFRA